MGELRDWIAKQPARRAPLFQTSEDLSVHTHPYGKDQRPVVTRHPRMEEAIIEEVESGLSKSNWRGFLYIMGWGGDVHRFTPLYVGMSSRKGKTRDLNANLENIRGSKGKFARWGDGNEYHIGDLSRSLFRWKGHKEPVQKYDKWAEMLFQDQARLQLRERTYLYIIPWLDGSVTPSGRECSLKEAEAELIELALAEYEDVVLNVKGETWWNQASSTTARPPNAHKPRRPIQQITDRDGLSHLCRKLQHEHIIGLDVETEMWPPRRLCLVQIGTPDFTALIDALRLGDLSALAPVMSAERPIKIIHNAPFERRILGELGFTIAPVFDTLKVSRELHGRKVKDGHGLAAVCRRELRIILDKADQCSDWTRRPLTNSQRSYAALDAEVMIDLYQALQQSRPPALFF